jgi:hypothetical protein
MSFIGDLFGGGQADAADNAAASQERAANRAITETRAATIRGQNFLAPFGDVAQRGIDESSFLANPEAQFESLQNNPLFKLALDNANEQTNAKAASQGRLSSGDTLERLSNNVLLSAQPLINNQRQDINNLLNLGSGIARSSANTAINQGSTVSGLLTDIGSAQSAGMIANQNARSEGAGNVLSLAGTLFSDSRLKKDAEITGVNESGYNLWKWRWNDKARKLFGLKGDSFGVMFSDVLKKDPDAVSYESGYGKVNYKMIGVEHGA